MKTLCVGLRRFVLVLIASACCLAASSSSAANVWDGGAFPDPNWGAAANWDNDVVPAPPPFPSLLFDGNANLNTFNNLNNFGVSNLTFNAGAGSFTLSGNPVLLIGAISNYSSSLQTVALGVNLPGGTVQNIHSGGGGLLFSGPVVNLSTNNNVTTLSLFGGSTTFRQLLSPSTNSALRIFMNENNATTLNFTGNQVSTLGRGQLSFHRGVVNFGSATDAPVLTIDRAGSLGDFMVIGGTTGSATFNMKGGALNITSTDLSRRFVMAPGSGGQAFWNQTGGNVTFNLPASPAFGLHLARGMGSYTEVNISGGTFDVGSANVAAAFYGSNNITISGTGSFRTTGVIATHDDFMSGNARATIRLDGGELVAGEIRKTGSNYFALHFNGGKLTAAGDNSNFVHGLTAVTIEAGGAKIDSGVHNVAITQALLHDPALGAMLDGGLDKYGSGILTLPGTNTYNGGTRIHFGTLNIHDIAASSLGTGAVMVNAGARLGGSGYINGHTTVKGTLAPDGASGFIYFQNGLAFQDTGVLSLEIAGLLEGLQYDVLFVDGLLSLDGTLQVAFGGGFTGAEGASFDLIDFGTRVGTFDSLILPSLANGWTWDTSQLHTQGILTIVPEPSAVALALLGAALFQVRRRSNRR